MKYSSGYCTLVFNIGASCIYLERLFVCNLFQKLRARRWCMYAIPCHRSFFRVRCLELSFPPWNITKRDVSFACSDSDKQFEVKAVLARFLQSYFYTRSSIVWTKWNWFYGKKPQWFNSWNRTLPHVVVNHCGAHESFPHDLTVTGLEFRGQASSGNSWYKPPTTPAQNTDLNWVPVPHSTEHCKVNVAHCQDVHGCWFSSFCFTVLSTKNLYYYPFAMFNCKSEDLFFRPNKY